jgi:transcriptional regulator with XRE-family HTH domain
MSHIPHLIIATDVQDAVRTAAKARRIALGLSQADLSARSGVPIATLKRFEQRGEASFTTILALAEVLDALAEFQALFPTPDIRSLEDLDRQEKPRQRVRRPKSPQP